MSVVLKSLNGQKNWELESVETSLLAVFSCNPNSNLSKKIIENLKNRQEELKSSEITVILVWNEEIDSKNLLENFDDYYYLDNQRQLLNLSPKVKDQSRLGENLIIFHKKENNWEYADTKESPELEYDWIEVVYELSQNYASTEIDDGIYYRWGQIVPEDGEYMCKDCGFVTEFKKGDIFPICELCLAGEPSGPSTTLEGYWEKI